MDQLLAFPEGTRLVLLAPLVRAARGGTRRCWTSWSEAGLRARARRRRRCVELDAACRSWTSSASTPIEAVVDRLVVTDRMRSRLTDSVELALRTGEGVWSASEPGGPDGGPRGALSSREERLPALRDQLRGADPAAFLLQQPLRRLPDLPRAWARMEVFDEELVVPDPALSLEDGAVHAWRRGGRRLIVYYKRLLRAVAQALRRGPGDTPFAGPARGRPRACCCTARATRRFELRLLARRRLADVHASRSRACSRTCSGATRRRRATTRASGCAAT